MGLDQYLYARRHVDDDTARQILELTNADDTIDRYYISRSPHSSPAEIAIGDQIVDLAGLRPLIGPDSFHLSIHTDDDHLAVSMVVLYWRKANAVHQWFVDNVQNGVDDCGTYEVHPELLTSLAVTCARARAAYGRGDIDEAEALMPPQSGFFFGSTDIDEWWAINMADTANGIRRVIDAAIAVRNVTFAYSSSW